MADFWVYEIRDIGGEPFYVGVTGNPAERWACHLCRIKGGMPIPLYRDFKSEWEGATFEAVAHFTNRLEAQTFETARVAALAAQGRRLANRNRSASRDTVKPYAKALKEIARKGEAA